VQVPQAKCWCGGYVHLKYQTLRQGKRIWDDLALEIQAEYGRRLSYRQIKVDLDRRLHSSDGLCTLNQKVLPLGSTEGSSPRMGQGEVPPVVRLGGIWITVTFATGETRTDQTGHTRLVKQAKKVPILAAQGVWPTTGRTRLLAWMRADSEDFASWQKFLEALYEASLTPENGLALLV